MSEYMEEFERQTALTLGLRNYGRRTPAGIFKIIARDGYWAETDRTKDELRAAAVDTQFCSEVAATIGLEKGFIKAGAITIHTPKPGTPLLSDGTPSNIVLTTHTHTVSNRNQALKAFMAAGGQVITTFPKTFDWSTLTAEQIQHFADLYDQYGGEILVVAHVDNVPPEMTGATAWYLSSAFSKDWFGLLGAQADKVGKISWMITAGDPHENDYLAVHGRKVGLMLQEQNETTQNDFVVPVLG